MTLSPDRVRTEKPTPQRSSGLSRTLRLFEDNTMLDIFDEFSRLDGEAGGSLNELRNRVREIDALDPQKRLAELQAGGVLAAVEKLNSSMADLDDTGSLANQIAAWCRLAQAADLTNGKVLDALLSPLERLNQAVNTLATGSGESEDGRPRYEPISPICESFWQQRNRAESERAEHDLELKERVEKLQRENERLRQKTDDDIRTREEEYPTTAKGFVKKHLPDMLKLIEAGYLEDKITINKDNPPFRTRHLAELLKAGRNVTWSDSTIEQDISDVAVVYKWGFPRGRYRKYDDTDTALMARLRGYLTRKPAEVPAENAQHKVG